MFRPVIWFTTACALVSAASTNAAAPRECLTRDEMRGLMTVVLPATVEAVAGKCATTLPDDAYLLTGAKGRVAELRAMQPGAFSAARSAFAKFGARSGKANDDGLKLLDTVPAEMLLPLIEGAIVAELVSDFRPASCADADRIASPLAALPAANLIDLLTEVFIVAARDDKDITACPA